MKIYVIKNEQHKLLKSQEEAISDKFQDADIDFINIPVSGIKKEQIEDMVIGLDKDNIYIFMSPIPYFMKLMAYSDKKFYVFHNDNRIKKELPNGKIIMTVPEYGWEVL